MTTHRWMILLLLAGSTCTFATDNAVLHNRRQRAADTFHDGILLVHALSRLDLAADGYRQDPDFDYLTGQENVIGAWFAIDGKSGDTWSFLPSDSPFTKSGLKPSVVPGDEAAKRLGIGHVVDWSELEPFLAANGVPNCSATVLQPGALSPSTR